MSVCQHRIVLIGAGQLGSRHLQGLANIDIPVSIDVIDPNEASLQTARERYAQIAANPNISKVRFLPRISDLSGQIDLAIVATGADVRADVISSLVLNYTVRNLLMEKVLFQKEADFDRIATLLSRQQVYAEVNCPRRIFPFYLHLKEILSVATGFSFSVDGSNWGMGCNAIHFLDLFAHLSGNSVVEIKDVLLNEKILESKRPGFVEFTGTISGNNLRGDSFSISSRIEPDVPLKITIKTDAQLIEIDESAGKASFFNKVTEVKSQESFVLPYQSQLTGIVARDILLSGAGGLTPYSESAQLHIPILRAFLTHLNRVSEKHYDFCPIT